MELKEEEVEKEEEVDEEEKQRSHDEEQNILFGHGAVVPWCHGGHKSINLNRLNVFMALFGIFGIYCFCEL